MSVAVSHSLTDDIFGTKLVAASEERPVRNDRGVRRTGRFAVAGAVLLAVLAGVASAEVRPTAGDGEVRAPIGAKDSLVYRASFKPARIAPGQPVRVRLENLYSQLWKQRCVPLSHKSYERSIDSVPFKQVSPGRFPPSPRRFDAVWQDVRGSIRASGRTYRWQRVDCAPVPRYTLRIVTNAIIPGSATRSLKRGCYITGDGRLSNADSKKADGTIAVLSVGGVDCVGG